MEDAIIAEVNASVEFAENSAYPDLLSCLQRYT